MASGRPCIWVMGGPGAGKGTQCRLLAELTQYRHLSTGDLLRNEVVVSITESLYSAATTAQVLAGTERWVRLFQLITAGQLVPDDEVVSLLAGAVEQQTEAPGFLLDGFPANLAQAELARDRLGPPARLLLLDVPDAVMMSRLKDGENFNDTEETILKRIRTFHEVTAPVVASFADVATRVNANRVEQEVFDDIRSLVEN